MAEHTRQQSVHWIHPPRRKDSAGLWIRHCRRDVLIYGCRNPSNDFGVHVAIRVVGGLRRADLVADDGLDDQLAATIAEVAMIEMNMPQLSRNIG